MSYEQKPGTGTLWENDRKQSESHPDYRGGFIIPEGFKSGDTIYLSAWLKEPRDKKLISLSHDAREQQFQDNKSGRIPKGDREGGERRAPPQNDRASGQRSSTRASDRAQPSDFSDDDDLPF